MRKKWDIRQKHRICRFSIALNFIIFAPSMRQSAETQWPPIFNHPGNSEFENGSNVSAFASTSDRPLCFPRACVGLIGPRPSDYPHALSACYYFLPAVFLLALGLWSSLPARQLSLDTSYLFLTFSVFFCFFFKVLKG